MADTKVVKKSLAGAEDMLRGTGTVLQNRAGQAVQMTVLHLPTPVESITALANLDPTPYKYAAIINSEKTNFYVYKEQTGGDIASVVAAGSWFLCSSANSTKYAERITGMTFYKELGNIVDVIAGKTFTGTENGLQYNGEYYKMESSAASVPEPRIVSSITSSAVVINGVTIPLTKLAPSVVVDIDAKIVEVTTATLLSSYKQLHCATYKKQMEAGARPTIMGVGDSVMWGATVGNLGVQDPNNPLVSLRATLQLCYGGNYVTIINAAVSGTTLQQMLDGTDGSGSTYETKISVGGVGKNAAIVYCNHAINDSQLNNDLDQYRANLVTFVDLTRKHGKVPVIVTPNPNPPILIIDEAKSKRLQDYVDTQRQVAAAMNVDLVDNYYWFSRTATRVSPITLVPDGAHLSTRAYQQYGANMAIPLLNAKTIRAVGESAGLSNTTYFDNATSARQIQSRDNHAGPVFTCDREASTTGINYPVIFDFPPDSLSYLGLQWGNAARCIPTLFGASSPNIQGAHFANRAYGSGLNWDSEMKMLSADLYAGLNVIGLLFDMSYSAPANNGLTFAGVKVPVKSFAGAAGTKNEWIGLYDFCQFIYPFVSGTNIVFKGRNADTVLTISLSGSTLTAVLNAQGSNFTTTLSTSVTAGTYNVSVRQRDGILDIAVGLVSASITLTGLVPDMYIDSPLIPYNVSRS